MSNDEIFIECIPDIRKIFIRNKLTLDKENALTIDDFVNFIYFEFRESIVRKNILKKAEIKNFLFKICYNQVRSKTSRWYKMYNTHTIDSSIDVEDIHTDETEWVRNIDAQNSIIYVKKICKKFNYNNINTIWIIHFYIKMFLLNEKCSDIAREIGIGVKKANDIKKTIKKLLK